ncbi:MAG: PilT/PilU family type 4a pilus ATPase [Patescibacteria group bacterium]|nr:PilT/PilU family type 4a pilus ATPase [Patescibacteria group bacterium]MDD5715719.1 PilT/PilU family type 4a pilus ATPase [Patescibacteria group bacterium]
MDTQGKLALDNILSTAAEQKASDLHLSVGSAPILRIDGKLFPLKDEPIITKEFMEGFVTAVLDIEQLKTLEQQKEVVLSYQFQKRARFRINVFYQKRVLGAYLRLIGDRILPLLQLGLPLSIENIAQIREGLLVVSGTFGSGKTTTSASIIDYINKNRQAYILTIEKPIEYIFNNQSSIIEQREVGRDTVSFDQALASIIQEDVDVLFVSELSSPDVIKHVLSIAASGRLVVVNVEADTTIRTLEYIINAFSANEQQQIRDQLSQNLAGIICQRLVPKIGGGQVAVAEIMTATPPIKSLIKEGSLYKLDTIIQTSREDGMVSLDWSLAELVKTNQVLIDDALENAGDPQQLKYMLRA